MQGDGEANHPSQMKIECPCPSRLFSSSFLLLFFPPLLVIGYLLRPIPQPLLSGFKLRS